MNKLFKKNFWIVKLLGLVLLALVSALLVNDVVASYLLIVPEAKASRSDLPSASDSYTAYGRIPRSVTGDSLSMRRIFHLDPPEEPEKEDAYSREEREERERREEREERLSKANRFEPSQLPIELQGTFVASIPDFSYANVHVSGDQKVATVGSEYLDGKARVVKIAPGHIILEEDSGYTYVLLWEDPAQKSARANAPPSPTDPAQRRNPRAARPGRPNPLTNGPLGNDPSANADNPASGVTKTGAYDYQIDRKMLDNQLKDMSRLQQDGRAIPHYKDNKYQGFKLVGVRPGSLYRSIGIRSGDIISSVNGIAIDSPNKALELFEQLKSSNRIKVEIERRGQNKTLDYQIQ